MNPLSRLFGVSLLAVLVLPGCGGSGGGTALSLVVVPNLIEIPVSGLSIDFGNFDPAPTRDASGGFWMSYSHVSVDVSGINLIETRLATSGDGGSSWQDVGLNINPATVFVINTDTVATTYEVSRLIYNPFAASAGADPWVLLFHRYLGRLNGTDTDRLFEHGWIGMKSAATAMTLANERKLFAGSIYNTINDSDPLGAPEVMLNTIDAELSECVTFTEPGVLPKSSGIYVALLCATITPPGKIVLLRCDHGMNGCVYLGVLLQGSEAVVLGIANDNFSAAELVEAKGDEYLIVTPSAASIYRGCVVYKITDLDLAQIERSGGTAVATAIFEASGDFNGACGYVEGLTGSGVMMSKAFFSSAPPFRIFTTGFNF